MKLEKSKFYGTDRCNLISLLEYGLLVYSDKHEDNSGTQFCVYRIADGNFGTAHISEDEINSLLKGNDWANSEDIDSFLSFTGYGSADSYISNNNLASKLFDLSSYFGYENIFGTDYSPISEHEAMCLYL